MVTKSMKTANEYWFLENRKARYPVSRRYAIPLFRSLVTFYGFFRVSWRFRRPMCERLVHIENNDVQELLSHQLGIIDGAMKKVTFGTLVVRFLVLFHRRRYSIIIN